jgi:hypothetical protein
MVQEQVSQAGGQEHPILVQESTSKIQETELLALSYLQYVYKKNTLQWNQHSVK